MKNKTAHKTALILRQFMAIALLLVVLLSSCSLKRGVKVFFDIPVKTAQAGPLAHHMSSANHGETACLKCADLQVLTADSFDQSIIKNLSAAVLLTVVFSLLLLPFFRPEDKHIYRTPSLGKSIPKYLLFSKLLFYDIR